MSYIGNQPITAAFITDSFSGTGSQVAFTLTVAPAGGASIFVIVSGVVQDPSAYGVSGSTLTFSTAPPSGTGNISIRYLGVPAIGVVSTAYRTKTEFTATTGQTTFTPPSYTVGFLNVYRNGVLLGSADYTATNGITVVLANGATLGDLITTESFYVSSVLNGIPATSGSVGTTYLATASVTQAKLGTNVAGNGPAFAVYASNGQSCSGSTSTKITLANVRFDTNSNFSSSRFTPTVAGYYQISGAVTLNNNVNNAGLLALIVKSGNSYASGSAVGTGSQYPNAPVSALVYLNGSTDYIELHVFNSSTTATVVGGTVVTGDSTFLTGVLVRAA